MRFTAILVVIAMLGVYTPALCQGGWISIVSPAPGDVISGRNAEISISFNTGNQDRVTKVELAVDGTDYGSKLLSEPATRGIVSFILDTSRLGNGGHALLVKLYSGNRLIGSTAGSCAVGNKPVDVIPPEVQFTGIKDGATIKGVYGIKVRATDNSGEDPMISVFVDKSLKMIKNTPPYDYIWNTKECEDGKHVLTACAFDEAGNKGEAKALEIVIRNAGSEPISASPAANVVPASSLPSAAVTTPVIKVKPVDAPSIMAAVPAERPRNTGSARNANPTSAPREVVSKPAAPVDEPRSTSAGNTISDTPKPIVIAQAIRPEHTAADLKPVAPSISHPSEPVERANAAVTAPSGSAVSERSKPMVIASAPGLSEISELRAQMPTEPTTIDPPASTVPGTVSPELRKDIMASLPKDMIAPSRPGSPMTEEPATTANVSVSIVSDSAKVRSAGDSSMLGQKLATPKARKLPDPIKLAQAQRVDPVVEPRRASYVSLQTVSYKRAIVTEFRNAAALSGGTIIGWNRNTKTVDASFAGKRITLQVGKATAIVNGKPVALQSAPYVNKNGRTMVDVTLLKRVLGARVKIDDKTRTCKLGDA